MCFHIKMSKALTTIEIKLKGKENNEKESEMSQNE